MRNRTIFVSYADVDRDHPLFNRLSDDILFKAQVSFHMYPQHPCQRKDDLVFGISGIGIGTSDYFLYIVSNTTAIPRWVNTEPGLIRASELQLEGEGPEIISIKIDDVPLPLILKGTQCIDLTQDYEKGFRSLLQILHSPKLSHNSQHADRWTAAYYPVETISSPRSRTIMCLLFDKVICHFPISPMACGGGDGMSLELFGDDILVEAGILELREEVLFPEVEVDFSPGYSWGTDEEFDKYVRLQVTAMTMDVCSSSNVVPVTDDPAWPVPASMLANLDLLRFSHLQASALAMKSLEIALPPIVDVPDADILKAREELREQLIPFRRAVLALSPAVRSGIESEATLLDIHREAKYVVDTQVAPALGALQDRLAKEKGKFWRILLLKGSAVVPQFILNWTTKGALSAAVNAIGSAKDLTLDLIDHENLVASLKNQGGLGYLLAVTDHPSFKSKDRTS